MALSPALELAYLPKLKQGKVWTCMETEECSPSFSQAKRMRNLEDLHLLTQETIEQILREPKANQRPKISLPLKELEGCIPDDVPDYMKKEYVIKTLKTFNQMRKKK